MAFVDLGAVSAYADAKRGGYMGTYTEFCRMLAHIPDIARVNDNLLRNGTFADGCIVNQRGQTSYAGIGYGVDMWYTTGATLSVDVTAEGVKLYKTAASATPAWAQALETDAAVGQTVTVSMLYKGNGEGASLRVAQSGGIVTLSNVSVWTLVQKTFILEKWSVGTLQDRAIVAIQCFESMADNRGLYIKAIKLEPGTKQTLAHQENGVWVLNEIPDYVEQLRKCQRYLYVQSGKMITVGVITGSKKTLNLAVPVPVPMRSKPTLVGAPDVTNVRTIQGTNMDAEITSGTVLAVTSLDTNIAISVTTETFNTAEYVNNTPIVCYIGNVMLSAEL